MFTSCVNEGTKKIILQDFVKIDSTIRILIATNAFGLGIDAQGIKKVLHIYPLQSKSKSNERACWREKICNNNKNQNYNYKTLIKISEFQITSKRKDYWVIHKEEQILVQHKNQKNSKLSRKENHSSRRW